MLESNWFRSSYKKVNKQVKIPQPCPALCNPMDYTVYGILQARILEWAAFPFSRRSSQPRVWTQVAHTVGGFFTSWATKEAHHYISVANEVAQLCPTLCDLMDCSLPGSSFHGISQARMLEQVAVSSSRGSSRDSEIEPASPALAGRFFTTAQPLELQRWKW